MTRTRTGQDTLTVAMTGASGMAYGLRLVSVLLAGGHGVDLLLSQAGRVVLKEECDLDWFGDEATAQARISSYFACDRVRHFHERNWHAPQASGSGAPRRMVVCPCSMGTLAAVAQGLSDSLIERACDVMIKEGRRLVLVPRETPFSAIHLENMLKLSRLGVTILPAAPGFYQRPQSVAELVDFVVARVLDQLDIAHDLLPPWPRT